MTTELKVLKTNTGLPVQDFVSNLYNTMAAVLDRGTNKPFCPVGVNGDEFRAALAQLEETLFCNLFYTQLQEEQESVEAEYQADMAAPSDWSQHNTLNKAQTGCI